ncbi:MAG: hypothetical protein ACI3XA_05465 [Clostridia bacterium]
MESYVTLPDLSCVSNTGAENIERIIPSFSFEKLIHDITTSKNIFKADKIFETLLKIFAEEVYSAGRILLVIIAIILIGAILENLWSSFGKSNNISALAGISIVIGLAVGIFREVCTYATLVATDMGNIMASLLPVMMTLFAGSGLTFTGTVVQPVLYFMCNIFANLFRNVLIPLSTAYLAVSLSDELSYSVTLGKFRELIRKIYNFILGIVMTVFTGLLSISSFVTVALDSVGAKGARFALSSMVPFVGSSISDAMGAVVTASIVLKNAVGVTGIICMAAVCIIPIVKTGVVVLMIRIAVAITEPVADKRTVNALTSVGDSLSMINAAVISTAVMMIISIGIIVGIKG